MIWGAFGLGFIVICVAWPTSSLSVFIRGTLHDAYDWIAGSPQPESQYSPAWDGYSVRMAMYRSPKMITVNFSTEPPEAEVQIAVGYEGIDGKSVLLVSKPEDIFGSHQVTDEMIVVGTSPCQITLLDRGYTHLHISVNSATKSFERGMSIESFPSDVRIDLDKETASTVSRAAEAGTSKPSGESGGDGTSSNGDAR